MSKHTPGPWSVRGGQGDDGYCEYRHIYAPAAASKCVDAKISEADARLIAAAPDLLEALQRLRVEAQHFADNRIGEQFFRAAIDGAVEAIAKATGGDHE